jgi:hypothetical protein
MAVIFSNEFVKEVENFPERYLPLLIELKRVYGEMAHAAIHAEGRREVLCGQAQGIFDLAQQIEALMTKKPPMTKAFFA